MTQVVGPWGFSYTGRAGHESCEMSNTGKLSTRNVEERLEWITFDDIIRTLVRVAKLIVKARVNRLVMILKRGKNPLSNMRQDKRSYSALA